MFGKNRNLKNNNFQLMNMACFFFRSLNFLLKIYNFFRLVIFNIEDLNMSFIKFIPKLFCGVVWCC